MMKALLVFCVIAVAMVVSCTSPVDLVTPRNRTAEAAHVPLPESLRVRPISTSISVEESDYPNWIPVATNTVIVTIDTTFHPPLHWISGLLMSNTTNPLPSITRMYFHCDTVPADTTRLVLKGDEFRILAAQKISGTIFFDTLNSDTMIRSMLFSGHVAGTKAISDTFLFYFTNGVRGGDSTILGKVFMKITW